MPSEAIARQAAMIREFIAFVYGLILLIPTLPRRIAAMARFRFLNPRLQSASWKLAVPRPPAISSDFLGSFVPEYRGFDQWIANTRENTGMIVTEAPGMTVIRPRIASWGYAPP